MRVVIKLSDPWEMGEALGWPAISGTVAHSEAASWLVELDRPFVHANAEYRFLVVSSRHEDKSLANAVSEDVLCNIIRTTPERASSESPCDVSWWRGGHAMIGSVRADAARQTDAANAAPRRR
jgi:hypothetical protein